MILACQYTTNLSLHRCDGIARAAQASDGPEQLLLGQHGSASSLQPDDIFGRVSQSVDEVVVSDAGQTTTHLCLQADDTSLVLVECLDVFKEAATIESTACASLEVLDGASVASVVHTA